MKVDLQIGITSRFKLIAVNPETNAERDLTGWSGNTLLTTGRNELAQRSWFTTCKVGTDDTTPAAGQTDLLGYVASTTTIVEDVHGAQGSAPLYGWRRKRFRFAVGAAGGENLNEVSMGWATGIGDNVVTRSLLVDINGDRVTVTPLSDEILDVVIEVRYYPPLTDATGTVVFDGVTYDYILRARIVTSATAWGSWIGSAIASYSADVSHWPVYDDDIQAITLGPLGVATNSDTSLDYTQAYVANSYQVVFGMTGGPIGWNSLTNKLMRSLSFITTAGYYQIQFDSQASPGNGIPKIDTKIITVQFVLGWDEQVIP